MNTNIIERASDGSVSFLLSLLQFFVDVEYDTMSDSDSDDSTRSPGEEAFLTINDVPIYFNEDWGTGIGGGLWTTGKIPEMM